VRYWVLTLLAACAVSVGGFTRLGSASTNGASDPDSSAGDAIAAAMPVETAGRDQAGDAVDLSPATIHEIETITGATDQHSLVGRQVDLDLSAGPLATQTAFWVGSKDNRVLVVLGQNNRTQKRRPGQVATSGVTPVQPGEALRIVGTIEAVPPPSARYSRGLEESVRASLRDEKIYIRATSLSPE
jgi:hypothetical protein